VAVTAINPVEPVAGAEREKKWIMGSRSV
jgi:hypothetical protein